MKSKIEVRYLSQQYSVQALTEQDVATVYELAIHNPQYYRHCPPPVTKENILQDMRLLPPHTTPKDKYYLGFWEENNLVAVLDLVTNYPNHQTAFIGFFMVAKNFQGRGIGSAIIAECGAYLKKVGYSFLQLGYAQSNLQSANFWHKNGFQELGVAYPHENYTAVMLQKTL